MSKKLRFKPVITRVKLNPEQAVLSCNCHNTHNGDLVSPTAGAGPVIAYCIRFKATGSQPHCTGGSGLYGRPAGSVVSS